MAKGKTKKKVVAATASELTCMHCHTEFKIKLRWCTQCECHMGLDHFRVSQDVCDRCGAGDNKRYLKWKKTIGQRVDADIAAIIAEHGPVGEPFKSPLVAAYDAWVASPEYAHRFDSPDKPREKTITAEEENEQWIQDNFAGL